MNFDKQCETAVLGNMFISQLMKYNKKYFTIIIIEDLSMKPVRLDPKNLNYLGLIYLVFLSYSLFS